MNENIKTENGKAPTACECKELIALHSEKEDRRLYCKAIETNGEKILAEVRYLSPEFEPDVEKKWFSPKLDGTWASVEIPNAVISALQNVLDCNWEAEMMDFFASNDEAREKHVYPDMVLGMGWLNQLKSNSRQSRRFSNVEIFVIVFIISLVFFAPEIAWFFGWWQ